MCKFDLEFCFCCKEIVGTSDYYDIVLCSDFEDCTFAIYYYEPTLIHCENCEFKKCGATFCSDKQMPMSQSVAKQIVSRENYFKSD